MSAIFLTIGEMAKRSGLTAKMIRHYESLGLLPPAIRSEAGYRQAQRQAVNPLRKDAFSKALRILCRICYPR